MKKIDQCIDYLTYKVIDDDQEYEIYRYAFFRLKSIIKWMTLLFFIGVLTRNLKVSSAILIAIIPIRKFGGGFHFKSEMTCFIASSLVLYIASKIVLAYNIPLYNIVVVSTFSCILIFINGTVESMNRKLDVSEKRIFGIITRSFLLFELAVVFFLQKIGLTEYSRSILVGINLCAIFQILSIILGKEKVK